MVTLEAQATSVRNAMRGKVSAQDRENMKLAEETLTDLAKLRRKIMDGVGKVDDDQLSDDISAEIVRLLDLPTSE